MIQMFLSFSYFSTNLDNVYLCLPLLTFVYLCSTDASMHKLCACSFFLRSSSKIANITNHHTPKNGVESHQKFIEVIRSSLLSCARLRNVPKTKKHHLRIHSTKRLSSRVRYLRQSMLRLWCDPHTP